jgi:hypothetical protein
LATGRVWNLDARVSCLDRRSCSAVLTSLHESVESLLSSRAERGILPGWLELGEQDPSLRSG